MKTVFNFLWLWLIGLSATAQSTVLNFKGVFDMSVSDDKIYTATSEGLPLLYSVGVMLPCNDAHVFLGRIFGR